MCDLVERYATETVTRTASRFIISVNIDADKYTVLLVVMCFKIDTDHLTYGNVRT